MSARHKHPSGSSQSSDSTATSTATDPTFKTPPPVGRGGLRGLLRQQANQSETQSPRLASATISSAAQLEQLEAQTKVMGLQENLDWATRSTMDDPAPTSEHPGLESAANMMPTLSQTAPVSVASALQDPVFTEEELMDTGAEQTVQDETEISEDLLLDPAQDNLSQNNSSAQATEDGDKDRQTDGQSTDVQTVSESSGAETQPDSDHATDPGEGKT